MGHDAFISYSRKDKDFALRLHKALANYLPPGELRLPRRRLNVFRDAEDFTGAEYYQSLDRHLNDSAKLIVLCSPAARASQFVDDEIRRFAHARGPNHIVALLVAGIPNNEAGPQQQAQMAFPDALCEALQMPLAADYRGFDPARSRVDRGAYEASWYTTLANLYDISRAQIEQREKKRRARRRRITGAVTALSIIVLAGLSFLAWKKWQDADRQESVAAARFLTGRAVATESRPASQGMRLRAMIAAESLRKAWTREGYDVWRRATLQMPPALGRMTPDSMFIRMAFTADGKQLFALCGERHIHVLAVPGLQELKKLEASATAYQLAIDAQGAQALAYQADDEAIEVFDVPSGAKRVVFLPASFQSASFSPAGEAIVISAQHLWVLDGHSDQVRSRIAFPKEVSAVTLSLDGATALALSDRMLSAYDTVDGKVRWRLALTREVGRALVVSDNGRFAMLEGADALSIVNVKTGETLESLPVESHARGRALMFGDGAYVFGSNYARSGGVDLVLPFSEEQTPPAALPAISASGRYIASSLRDDGLTFAVVDLSIGGRSAADDPISFYLTLQRGHRGKVAAFTPDDTVLALSSWTDGGGPDRSAELQLVSLQTERWRPIIPNRSRTGDLNVLPPHSRVVAKHRSAPAARSFDANGRPIAEDVTGTLVSRSGRFAARLESGKGWIITDTTNNHSVTIPANGSPIEFSPDEGRVLVFPKVYALDDPASQRSVAEAKPLVQTWSFPGSNLVIGVDSDSMSVSDAKKSVLFDWRTGKVSEGPGSVNSIYAISPDGSRFITYGHDALLAWEPGATQPGRQSEPVSLDYDTPVHFSPDGTLLAVARCRSVPLYDADSLTLRFAIPIGTACFTGFSADGRYVVSHTWHGDVPEPQLHPIDFAGMLEETCSRVRDNLTEREWNQVGAPAVATCPGRNDVHASSPSSLQ